MLRKSFKSILLIIFMKNINLYLKLVFVLCALSASPAYASDKLFKCKIDAIEGANVSALFSVQNTGSMTLDFFDDKNVKVMACRLSAVYARFSPRAQTNNIVFDFKKDSCVLLSRNVENELLVRDKGFLKISNSVSEGEHNSYLLIFDDRQPLGCDVKDMNRAELEYLAGKISRDAD